MSADVRFAGRNVLVTGAGRPGQVGEAVMRAFGAAGARLAFLERDTALTALHEAALGEHGVACRGWSVDLTDTAATERVAAEVAGLFPDGLHAMVHLAGGFAMSGPLAESDPAVWHRQIAINLTTAYVATRAFLPLLRRGRGSLVYFASAAALPGASVAKMAAYAAAKSGVLTLMRAVAAEERAEGVRANALAPTAIRTAVNVAEMGADASYVERETVAHWVLQLSHPETGPVTGQVIRLG